MDFGGNFSTFYQLYSTTLFLKIKITILSLGTFEMRNTCVKMWADFDLTY